MSEGGLACAVCHLTKPKDGYSKKQLKAKGKRRCNDCVSAGIQLPGSQVSLRYAHSREFEICRSVLPSATSPPIPKVHLSSSKVPKTC